MAQRKPYNPNTKYGRQKLREQSDKDYANMTPQERQEQDSISTWVMVIILVVIGGFIYLIGGSGALLKWASR